ncbi:MobQ family relaxase [Edwardsiella piscicida]|uniref:MobQ family relaxase n=1 Tax=Edwardsiella piscicida TaxID=1263550 RepID=UPI000D52562E|nr:MobQ family relaxase [Edwardsiella piscicida]EKS7812712.1 MobA/MobL family protein [Edwardsiella piscicida]UCQ20452.1 MobA/MobL family protein [Edwardsiella piscicida]
MAIYSFSMENISRGEGKSSVSSAAYRHRKIFVDDRTGDIHGTKTAHKKDLFYAEIFAPINTPSTLISDSETLWNAVEASEKRKDARLAKEFKIALPTELTPEQSINLLRKFVHEHFVEKGMIVDAVIHDINGKNPHIHLMGATREVLDTGFGKKVREWDRPETLDGWRKGWQDVCNKFLEMHGHFTRIDHRSVKAQHTEALANAEIASTNEEKAEWLAKAVETDRAGMRRIPRSGWKKPEAQQQRAEEQAIRDQKLEEAKETYFAFKDLPLEIVVDVSSSTVYQLPKPEEIILPDHSETSTITEGVKPALVVPAPHTRPAVKSYRDPNKLSKTIATGNRKPSLVVPVPHTRTKLKTSSSSTTRAIKRAPVKSKRKQVKPRQDGIFKRFTLFVVEYIREKFVWAKRKPIPVSVDAEHDKRTAENYVFDEVLGIYVPRAEHERRVRFNSDDYKPTKEEIRRFPSRPVKPVQPDSNLNYTPTLGCVP